MTKSCKMPVTEDLEVTSSTSWKMNFNATSARFYLKLIAHIFRSQRYFGRLSINYNAQQMIATIKKFGGFGSAQPPNTPTLILSNPPTLKHPLCHSGIAFNVSMERFGLRFLNHPVKNSLNFRHPSVGVEFLSCLYYQLQPAITIVGLVFSSK